ncbi:hypothetical protein GNF10_26010 [Nostoc sp. UCD121]|uniref:hypothetical protein n=1 Tax=unclassified Nostoc TaxID=2593658 RepID=UPI0016234EAE|nr:MULTISPECIES: hypothetical protein [unclassified Nostoc]MBC1224536.1 hypothetical protein [Nostoc sp. UCD120]MBC1279320.1 hypothetical protein [Nostoc sp. UCD121]MBC1295151.1 hypothetical protein [Nostoc sp. UCD122]
MTTDLVTYYGQTPTIDQLVNKYGVYLEKLNRETKLLLRVTLSTYIVMQQEYTPTEYPVSTALEDALCELVIPDSIPQDLYDVCSALDELTTLEAETILEALQHQIRWGNARIQGSV